MSFSGTKGYITKPKPGVMLDPWHSLSQGLVNYWLFNEGAGSLANDISGHRNHGTLTNITPNTQGSGWGDSKFGGGLQFDGSNDYVSFTEKSLGNKVSISTWINCTSKAGAYRGIIGSTGWTAGDLAFQVQTNNTITYSVKVGVSARSATSTTLLDATNYRKWYHVVGVYDGSAGTLKIYVNGMLENTTYSTGSQVISINLPRIGATYDNTRFFAGSIDLIHIYNRVLSLIEINQLYETPFCNLLQVPIRRYYVPTVGVSPTSVFYGPLIGPFGGPI